MKDYQAWILKIRSLMNAGQYCVAYEELGKLLLDHVEDLQKNKEKK